ncbi:unnamed protein product [Auanema sp. JU1783]|nr:unnamed protein product [Auanema sp. JU1783]
MSLKRRYSCLETKKSKLDETGLKGNDLFGGIDFLSEGTLECAICLDIMHNVMNVSPCNHKFCAGCIYQWANLNKECPKCRFPIIDLSRDHLVNRIIEDYLTRFPEKSRPDGVLVKLDEKELSFLVSYSSTRFIYPYGFFTELLNSGENMNSTLLRDFLRSTQRNRFSEVHSRIELLRLERDKRENKKKNTIPPRSSSICTRSMTKLKTEARLLS